MGQHQQFGRQQPNGIAFFHVNQAIGAKIAGIDAIATMMLFAILSMENAFALNIIRERSVKNDVIRYSSFLFVKQIIS